MTAILLALGSGVGYGVSDFLASRVARRVPPVLLVLYSQALQSVVLLVVVVAVRQPYSPGGLAWGTVSGAIGAAGLVAYYQALATGQTAIVALWPPAAPCCRCWSTWPGASGPGRWSWPAWSWCWAGSR
jgi:drug/metabolite transporter (DMT)-like permease